MGNYLDAIGNPRQWEELCADEERREQVRERQARYGEAILEPKDTKLEQTHGETVMDLLKNVGRKAYWSIGEGVLVLVEVTDARLAYGHVLVKIRPVAGTGEMWVRASGLNFPPSDPTLFAGGASHE